MRIKQIKLINIIFVDSFTQMLLRNSHLSFTNLECNILSHILYVLLNSPPPSFSVFSLLFLPFPPSLYTPPHSAPELKVCWTRGEAPSLLHSFTPWNCLFMDKAAREMVQTEFVYTRYTRIKYMFALSILPGLNDMRNGFVKWKKTWQISSNTFESNV